MNKRLKVKPLHPNGQECDLGHIIYKHLAFLMVLFKDEIKPYRFEHITKCLTTAVMMMFLYIGKNVIPKARYCDVSSINERFKSTSQNENKMHMKKLYNDILEPSEKTRSLYYILLTDGTFRVRGSDDTRYFPGHVLVIEKFKLAHSRNPVYYIYQSYINKYDLNRWYDMNDNEVYVTMTKMRYLMHQLGYLLNASVWDVRCEECWADLTGLKKNHEFMNCEIRDIILMCWFKEDISTCSQVLQNMLNEKLQQGKVNGNDRLMIQNILKEFE